MRTPQATDYSVIQNEIQELRQEAEALEAKQAEVAKELNTQLTASSRDFNGGRVQELRMGMDDLARRLQLVEARISARSQTLPSEAARAEAAAEARAIAASADEAARAFESAWRTFVDALRAASRASRDLLEAREVTTRAGAKVRDLVHRFGIAVRVPGVQMPDAKESKLAGHIASHLVSIGFDCTVDSTAELYVRASEQEVDAAVPSSTPAA